jgi:hypothetical protein
MYGGIEDAEAGTKISATSDIYSMKLSSKEIRWEKEKAKGESMPRPRAQHVAVVTPK